MTNVASNVPCPTLSPFYWIEVTPQTTFCYISVCYKGFLVLRGQLCRFVPSICENKICEYSADLHPRKFSPTNIYAHTYGVTPMLCLSLNYPPLHAPRNSLPCGNYSKGFLSPLVESKTLNHFKLHLQEDTEIKRAGSLHTQPEGHYTIELLICL